MVTTTKKLKFGESRHFKTSASGKPAEKPATRKPVMPAPRPVAPESESFTHLDAGEKLYALVDQYNVDLAVLDEKQTAAVTGVETYQRNAIKIARDIRAVNGIPEKLAPLVGTLDISDPAQLAMVTPLKEAAEKYKLVIDDAFKIKGRLDNEVAAAEAAVKAAKQRYDRVDESLNAISKEFEATTEDRIKNYEAVHGAVAAADDAYDVANSQIRKLENKKGKKKWFVRKGRYEAADDELKKALTAINEATAKNDEKIQQLEALKRQRDQNITELTANREAAQSQYAAAERALATLKSGAAARFTSVSKDRAAILKDVETAVSGFEAAAREYQLDGVNSVDRVAVLGHYLAKDGSKPGEIQAAVDAAVKEARQRIKALSDEAVSYEAKMTAIEQKLAKVPYREGTADYILSTSKLNADLVALQDKVADVNTARNLLQKELASYVAVGAAADNMSRSTKFDYLKLEAASRGKYGGDSETDPLQRYGSKGQPYEGFATDAPGAVGARHVVKRAIHAGK